MDEALALGLGFDSPLVPVVKKDSGSLYLDMLETVDEDLLVVEVVAESGTGS